MFTPIERTLLGQLLPAEGFVVNVTPSLGTPPEISDLREFKPNLQIQSLSPDEFLDTVASSKNIRRVPLLNIEPSCSPITTLRGALSLLAKRRIDVVRFTFGPAFQQAGECFFDLSCFLLPWGFFLVRVLPANVVPVPPALPGQKHEPGVYLAISTRFLPMFSQQKTEGSLVDVQTRFAALGFSPRGVVHVGAHHAEELGLYKQMGFRKILFIEANPELAEEVRLKTAQDPSVVVAAVAASDNDGQVTLRITSNDMSSSILPLKKHEQYYPGIKETRQVTVPARRLDTLLRELNLNPADFNFLHLDIQGSELMALRGASGLLDHIDAINTEVNFEELYAGCARIEDIDDLLSDRGFKIGTVVCPYHASWGDAFYHRPPAPPQPDSPKRGTITMSTLGKNGRFANQLYQYAFLRLLADRHHMAVQTPPWIGQRLFAISDPPVSQTFPPLVEGRDFHESLFPNTLFETMPSSRELWGYFQFDTAHYAPYKETIRRLFQPSETLAVTLQNVFTRLGLDRKTLVCLHIRRGDYGSYGITKFQRVPSSFYRDWLADIWPRLQAPVLFIASDEPQNVLPDFADYHPLTTADLGVQIPEAPFFLDFMMLTEANILGISNSSFSFFAALLNRRATQFVRPNHYLKRLVPFDPWNAVPILHRGEDRPIWAEPTAPAPPAPAVSAPVSQPATPPGAVQVIARTPTGAPIITFGRKS